MKVSSLFLLAFTILGTQAMASDCTNDWKSFSEKNHCEYISYSTKVTYPITSIFGNSPDEAVVKASIRAGFKEENKNVPFKGNVIYFQGLADSMLNHKPLFTKLTNAGFRVIAFDYMGQGGSTGSMNDTRLIDIPKLGDIVYKRYARDQVKFKKPMIIGWSTGGLAGYLAALSESASKVVLIAPGIVPKVILGEQDFFEFEFDKITLETLTSKRYKANEYNPHVDGINPKSPLKVKDFATDLITTSLGARFKTVPASVQGLVLLSGLNDSYVSSIKSSLFLSTNAKNFKQVFYANSLHEIDNEIAPIADDAHNQILNFLLK
jgi:pimeloyl-ACP methyl ester carboxylesterase